VLQERIKRLHVDIVRPDLVARPRVSDRVDERLAEVVRIVPELVVPASDLIVVLPASNNGVEVGGMGHAGVCEVSRPEYGYAVPVRDSGCGHVRRFEEVAFRVETAAWEDPD